MIRLFMEAHTEELLNLQHLNILLSIVVYTKSWVVVVQTCLVYAIGVENYTFEAQTTHLRLHYTNYANDFVSATR